MTQHVVHLPSGRKGYAVLPAGDLVEVRWGNWASQVDHADLRTLPDGRRI